MAVGQSISMVDSQQRVTGGIDYTLNFELPRMLHACVLHSPHAHARIVKVDASKAEKLPGVAAVLTREDLIGDDIDPYFGLIIQDQTPVALDTVRFVGEAVAAVAAADADTAAEAVELIDVEYEELPAVFDPEEALKPGAPILHPGPRRIIAGRPDVAARSLEGTNIVHLFKQRKGDMARGFRDSDRIFENSFFSPSVNHLALEPHVTVAQVSGGRITVWTCNQNPHVVQRQLAGIFKVPIADVRVIVFTLGGGFGGKLNCKLEPAAVLLAKKTGRPVRMVARRAECFLLGVQHECKVKLKTGVKADGTLVAVEAYCYYNSGAYGDTTPNLITRGYAATGPYRVPHLYMDSYGVTRTLRPPRRFEVTVSAKWLGRMRRKWTSSPMRWVLTQSSSGSRTSCKKAIHFRPASRCRKCITTSSSTAAAEKIGWQDGPLVLREGNQDRAKGIGCHH